MRFLIIVKATPESEAGRMPSEELLARMAEYHEQLAQAGLLRDGSGLRPSSSGWRVEYDGAQTTLVDGPFAETRELVAGYTLIETETREQALEWTRRFPNPAVDGGRAQIEVRPLFELEDFEDGPAMERHRALDASQREKRS